MADCMVNAISFLGFGRPEAEIPHPSFGLLARAAYCILAGSELYDYQFSGFARASSSSLWY